MTCKNFEAFLVQHCAPTLAGVKLASMFRYYPDSGIDFPSLLDYWNKVLEPRGLSIRILQKSARSNSYLVYVFRIKQLESLLSADDHLFFLNGYGYSQCASPDSFLETLSERISEEDQFPHEIGLFLGYPLHDVKGFIENRGQNYSCLGCWKVYRDIQQAQKSFERYKKCTHIYKTLYAKGRSIIQLAVAV